MKLLAEEVSLQKAAQVISKGKYQEHEAVVMRCLMSLLHVHILGLDCKSAAIMTKVIGRLESRSFKLVLIRVKCAKTSEFDHAVKHFALFHFASWLIQVLSICHEVLFSLVLSVCVLAMTSLIDSGAQFESQLKDAGLTVVFVDSLKRHGIRTLGQLAFAVGQPGQPIQDPSVEQLVQNALGRAPTLQETACVKRAAFEAQTYLTATLRQAVDRSEDSLPRKIPFAERQTRMEALKAGLTGLSVTGEHEPAHCVLDRACSMYEANSLKYMDLASCVSRSLEAQGTTKSQELTLEKGSLVMKSGDEKLQSATDSEIKVHYAMIRRGLTFQFAKLMSYSQHCE
eukprot:s209_g18.t1